MEEVAAAVELPESMRVTVLPRAFARFRSQALVRRFLGAFCQLLCDRLPRAVAVTASPAALAAFADALERRPPDCIVVDHFFAFGMVPSTLPRHPPLIYVAHNHEAEIWRDKYRSEARWAGRLLAAIEWIKTRNAERRLIDQAAAIVTLTRQDREKLGRLNATKPILVWPELSARKLLRWRQNASKTLLFVGSAAYFPNQDAIQWLLRVLMPRLWQLDRAIRLSIVGTAQRDVPEIGASPNVDFHGFVDDDALQQAYIGSALFICPVVLGSGVKIKVVEALSYGMPVALSEPSRAGVEFATAAVGFDREHPDVIAQVIASLLSDPPRLQRMSDEIVRSYDEALAARSPMAKMLSELLLSAPTK
jgi:glycosyltransferase involved in cell wall biosynthesis